MKVRVCPKCGKHNLEDAWYCLDCGETLSIKTIADVSDTPAPPAAVAPTQPASNDREEVIFYQSTDSFISNRELILSGETLRLEHIVSVEKVSSDARLLPEENGGERGARPVDILLGTGLVARAVKSVAGIDTARYLLRIHLRSGRIYDYISRSEDTIDAMFSALQKALPWFHPSP